MTGSISPRSSTSRDTRLASLTPPAAVSSDDAGLELAEDGACQLDGFIRPVAAQAVLEEAEMLSGKAFRADATDLDADPPYLVFEYILEGELRDYFRNLQAQGEQVPLRYFFRVAGATGDCPARQVDRPSPGRQRYRTARSYLTNGGSGQNDGPARR